MRKLAILPLLLAACSAGAPGKPGPVGGAAPCTALASEGGWLVTCPDGSSTEVAQGSCTTSDGADGSTLIHCADGTEATVRPPESIGAGAVIGRVALESRGFAAGVRVELVGAGFAATTTGDGTFRIDGIPPGTYAVRASAAPYQPIERAGVVVLEGTRDLGTIELALTQQVPASGSELEDLDLQLEGQLLVVGTEPPSVLDLTTGETFPIAPPEMGWIRYLSWLDAGTLLVEASAPDDLVGIWTRAGGLRWYRGLVDWDARAGGILATRWDDDGSLALWFLWDGVEQRLGIDPEAARWNLGDGPRWILSSDEGTFLVDGKSGTPEVTPILDRAALWVSTDPTSGDLAVLGFPGEQWAYDTVHRIAMVADEDAAIDLADGVASWRLADGRFVSWDSQAGTSIYRDAGLAAGWSPEHRWLWDGPTDGAYKATSRDGGTVIDLGDAPPDLFSPGERGVAFFREGSVRVIDLETRRVTQVFRQPQFCDWVDDGAIACSTEDGLLRIHLDGTIDSIGSVQSWQVQDGGLFYEAGDRRWFAGDDGTTVDLGSPRAFTLDPSRERVIWVTAAGNLYVRNLASRASVRIAENVEGYPIALQNVVLYETYESFTGARTIRYAPYP